MGNADRKASADPNLGVVVRLAATILKVVARLSRSPRSGCLDAMGLVSPVEVPMSRLNVLRTSLVAR
jgi:hypothetical protein